MWRRNYVVQYIIELKIPSSSARLISQFKGNYIQLAMQKFSSHVVEKCLKHFEETRPRIIRELLSVSHFEQLLQDPYANYVIQSALAVTKVWDLRFSLKIDFTVWSYLILFNAGESVSLTLSCHCFLFTSGPSSCFTSRSSACSHDLTHQPILQEDFHTETLEEVMCISLW